MQTNILYKELATNSADIDDSSDIADIADINTTNTTNINDNIEQKETNTNTNIIDKSCIICMEEYDDKIIFDCAHTICLLCYEKLLNSKSNDIVCPFCRGLVEKSDDTTINNAYNENNAYYEDNRNRVRVNIIRLFIAFTINLIIVIIIANIK